MVSPDPDEDAGDLTIIIQDDMPLVEVTQDRRVQVVSNNLRSALRAALVHRSAHFKEEIDPVLVKDEG